MEAFYNRPAMPLMSLSKLVSSSEDDMVCVDNGSLEQCRAVADETRVLLKGLREAVLKERKEFGEACGRTLLLCRAEAGLASARESCAIARRHREMADFWLGQISSLGDLVRSREEAERISEEKSKEAERHLADLVQIKLEIAMNEFDSLSRGGHPREPALVDVSATSRQLARQVK